MRGGMSTSQKNRWQKRSAQKIDRILEDILAAYEERGGIAMLRDMDDTTFMSFMLKVVEPYMREKSRSMAKEKEVVPVYELAPSNEDASAGAQELRQLYEQVKARMDEAERGNERGNGNEIEDEDGGEDGGDDAPIEDGQDVEDEDEHSH